MAPLINFFALLFLVSLLQHVKAHDRSLKSIKMNEKIIYDCVDIYKQPALDHPFLKNHEIQMKPSFLVSESRNEVSRKRGIKKNIRCPKGTVPIMRMRDDLIIAQQLVGRHSNPLAAGIPNKYSAEIISRAATKYRGAEAAMSGHKLNLDTSQASFSRIYVANGPNEPENTIQAGWMISPALYGDGNVWSYGSWTGINGSGCYNTLCKGFVQVAQNDPLSEPMDPSIPDAVLQFSILQDKQTGNWWITQITPDSTIAIGYWPMELFNSIKNGAAKVGFGGISESTPPDPNPPMGNGHLPTDDPYESARFSRLWIVDNNYQSVRADRFELERVVNSEKCFDLKLKGYQNEDVGVYFLYGGPGGTNCGS